MKPKRIAVLLPVLMILAHAAALGSEPGSLRWRFATDGEIITSPVITQGGIIPAGSWDHLYAVNNDGSLRWRFKTDDVISSSPAVDQDGTVYVGSWDHHLYAVAGTGEKNGALRQEEKFPLHQPLAPMARFTSAVTIATCMPSIEMAA